MGILQIEIDMFYCNEIEIDMLYCNVLCAGVES